MPAWSAVRSLDGRVLEQGPGHAFLESTCPHDDGLSRHVKILGGLGRRIGRNEEGDPVGRERPRERNELGTGRRDVKPGSGEVAFPRRHAGDDRRPGCIDVLELHLQHACNQIDDIDIDAFPLVGGRILDVPWGVLDVTDAHDAAILDRLQQVVSGRVRRRCAHQGDEGAQGARQQYPVPHHIDLPVW